MERFSKEFNSVDPISHRPFSAGHPDGVWVISIIYSLQSLGLLVLLVMGALDIAKGAEGGVGKLLGSLIGLVIFISAVIYLFKRSDVVIKIIGGISLLAFVAAVSSLFSEAGANIPLISTAALNGYFFYYTLTLKQDKLLN